VSIERKAFNHPSRSRFLTIAPARSPEPPVSSALTARLLGQRLARPRCSGGRGRSSPAFRSSEEGREALRGCMPLLNSLSTRRDSLQNVLTLAGVSFKTLFLLPLPIPSRSGRYINAKRLGLYGIFFGTKDRYLSYNYIC